jgi:hypothetical protein
MRAGMERRRLVVHNSQGFSSLDLHGLVEERNLKILVAFILLALANIFLFLQNAKGR